MRKLTSSARPFSSLNSSSPSLDDPVFDSLRPVLAVLEEEGGESATFVLLPPSFRSRLAGVKGPISKNQRKVEMKKIKGRVAEEMVYSFLRKNFKRLKFALNREGPDIEVRGLRRAGFIEVKSGLDPDGKVGAAFRKYGPKRLVVVAVPGVWPTDASLRRAKIFLSRRKAVRFSKKQFRLIFKRWGVIE